MWGLRPNRKKDMPETVSCKSADVKIWAYLRLTQKTKALPASSALLIYGAIDTKLQMGGSSGFLFICNPYSVMADAHRSNR
jgi:hypothetical protein